MIQLTAQRIRFACDSARPFASVTDAITGSAIALPSGSALQFELLFFFKTLEDSSLLDLAVFSSITVQLQDTSDPHNSTVFFSANVATDAFSVVTAANWSSGTAQHLSVYIPAAQNIVPPATTSYWICVFGTRTNDAQDLVLLAAANIGGKDSGVPQGVPTLPQTFKAGTKLSFICADGLTRDVQLAQMGNGRWSIGVNQAGYNGVGQTAIAIYCADGHFRDLSLVSQDGIWTIDLAQAGHS